MASMLRGELWWARLGAIMGHKQAGDRPVLVLSHAVFNARSGTVIAVALTSQEPAAGFPLTLELTSGTLPKRSWAKISHVRTLSSERIGRRPGRVAPKEMAAVVEGLLELVGD